jgi:hypothetical protein
MPVRSADGVTTTHYRNKDIADPFEAALLDRLGVRVTQRDYHVRAGCGCEWCTRGRAIRARNRVYGKGPYRNLGREGSRPAIERIMEAHASGITARQIAETVGVSYPYICHLLCEDSRGLSRYVSDRVMAATWPEPERTARGNYRGRVGVRVSSLASRRMLAALNAIGFSYSFMGKVTGIACDQLAGYVRGNRGEAKISFGVAADIKLLYDKYNDQDPVACGVNKQSVVSLQRKHARLRTPVPACWDEETIGDPNALPQWTGKCGTYAGFCQHYKYKIPVCEPCRKAGSAYKQEGIERRAREREASDHGSEAESAGE